MSRELISRSTDLKRLQDEGYEVDVIGGHLLLRHIPYVNKRCEVKYGILVSTLTLAGECTARPDTHVALFVGEQPCHKDGREIAAITHEQGKKKLAEGLEIDRSFSSKPQVGYYTDYYEKMTTYANILSGPAHALDPEATAKTFVVEVTEQSAIFRYTDTATARAGIGAVSKRLEGYRIGIVGLGGTGSYILDLIAKTPVTEIHLFDSDRFLQHNAFRAPGAPSIDQIKIAPTKVEYFSEIYTRMHKGIIAHVVRVDSSQAELLKPLDFIFLCVDSAAARREVIELLHSLNKNFIDVGMGVNVIDEKHELVGQLRVSTSTVDYRGAESRIPLSGASEDHDDDYKKNIQIADLNCLNATLAVIRWKRLCGFYQDLEREHLSIYALNVNQLLSEEQT